MVEPGDTSTLLPSTLTVIILVPSQKAENSTKETLLNTNESLGKKQKKKKGKKKQKKSFLSICFYFFCFVSQNSEKEKKKFQKTN